VTAGTREAAGQATAGLSVLDGAAVIVGMVVGIGIFGFPPLVAMHAPTPAVYIGLWLAGGLVMLVGALCYAELGSAYPDSGGEYHYLTRAWGRPVGLLFAWARGTVVQTGAIAAVAFIYGDYAQRLLPLGAHGPAVHAAIAVIALTAVNIIGTRQSKAAQLVFTTLTLVALASVMLAGVIDDGSHAVDAAPASAMPAGELAGMLGMGMVFVLLTYGGWNEAAYLSGELRNPQRDVSRVMLAGTAVVTAGYLLVNLAYLHIFGLQGLRDSQAVGADVMRVVAGPYAAIVLSLLICVTALSTINASIMTGARVYYALGRDVPALRALGAWSQRGATPVRGLLLQGAITLALVAFGAMQANGVQTMVAYTAPVFWLFMTLVAMSVWRLRRIDPQRPRPFRVPLYPVLPGLLALCCAGLLWSSAAYAGQGALLGLAVLAAGVPLLWLNRRALARTAEPQAGE
jgi:Amino acid transporters